MGYVIIVWSGRETSPQLQWPGGDTSLQPVTGHSGNLSLLFFSSFPPPATFLILILMTAPSQLHLFTSFSPVKGYHSTQTNNNVLFQNLSNKKCSLNKISHTGGYLTFQGVHIITMIH